MNKSQQYTTPSRFALLLLAVFVGLLIAKPVHSLLVHHDHLEGVCANQHEPALTTDHFKECPVCDFEFCTFIPQKQINVPQIVELIAKQQTVRTVSCFANTFTHLFQLRAPPAL
jgi:hypothetical protein